MQLDEIWAPIEGFPDYAVSNFGEVANLKYDRKLKPRIDSYRHCRVVLYNGRIKLDVSVHHLVAQAFLGRWRPGVKIKHIDEDNTNNHVLNLEFLAADRGLGVYRKNHPQVTRRRVRVVETNEVFRNVSDMARRYGTTTSAIYKVLRGERQSHKGLTFTFYED